MEDRNALTASEPHSHLAPRPDVPATRGRARRWLFRALAIAAGLLPLLLLEIGLRVFDLGRPAAAPDPFAGFNRNFPLFERQGAVYRTARAREPLIAAQEFPVEKPRNGFRIFCFGGSTVYGHPYLGDTAFPKWLELELAGSAPTRAWQAINCGGISYASYRIAPLVQEVLAYQPDLIVVATGHNEFLEDRTYTALKSRSAAWAWIQSGVHSLRMVGLARQWLLRGSPTTLTAPDAGAELGPTVSPRLDYESGYASYRRDAAWHQNVFAQYDESVRAMVAACQAARVPIVLVRLGSNLRDCPPFKSEHRAGLAPESEADWQAAFDLATAAEKSDPGRALQCYLDAAKIDGEHALLNFRIARVLDRIGRTREALTYYERARDEDICPLRIMSPLEKILSRIAADTRTPLIDAAALIAARTPDGIPGNDWYLDQVHPTIRGHQLIAQALAAEMRTRGFVAPSTTWADEQRRESYARQLAAVGPVYFADGRRRVAWLDQWSQRQRLAAEALPHDAASYARLCFRCLALGEDDAAWEALREALKRDASVSDLARRHAREIAAGGHTTAAAALLRHLP